jgi:GWxTD domain-containing protein
MTCQKYIVAVLFALLAATRLLAQEEPPTFPQLRPLYYYETVNLISEDTSKSRLDINIRIPYDFLVAVRNPESTNQSDFIKKLEVSAEIFDSSDVSAVRDMFRGTIHTQETKDTIIPDNRFIDINFSFSLSAGTYRLILEISDLESERKVSEKKEKVVLEKFEGDRLKISEIMFLSDVGKNDSSAVTLFPSQLGGNVSFGQNCSAYLEFTDNLSQPKVSYELSKIDPEKIGQKQVLDSNTLQPDRRLARKFLQPRYKEQSFDYVVKESIRKDRFGCVLPIRSDSLEQGHYELKVKVSDGLQTDSTVKRFQVRWADMPLSLRDIRLAIESLQHITTEEEYDELRSGSEESRKTKLEAFWKKKDPTPHTAFNEVMAEYYRRVDYTTFNFGTLRERDGWKTDRGKIYILFGPPTRTERKFSPDNPPQEVWYYTNLKKKFVFFDDSRSGNYKLLSQE